MLNLSIKVLYNTSVGRNIGSDGEMFFARPGEYERCGIFSAEHFILIAITVVGIIIALKCTSKKDTKKIIKNCTIFVWLFEIIIISFKIAVARTKNVNDFIPLYYCSILLYAGALSSFAKGNLKRTGDVFLATGGIVGGIVYLIFPSTSLLTYPAIHLVSMHSFIFHGIMIYLGFLIHINNYIELKHRDIIKYDSLVGIICIIAYIVNQIFDSNLMFISKNFKAVSIIDNLYRNTGIFFTPIMIISQCTLPFYLVYGMKKAKADLIIKSGNNII